jgi:hypothetical protein
MYFAKIPAKKALAEAGLAEMSGAESFWYVLQCVAFGAGYLAKVSMKKALSELAPTAPYDPQLGHFTAPRPALLYAPEEIGRGRQGSPPAQPATRRHARHANRSRQGW